MGEWINYFFLSLITKELNTSSFNILHHISLCNSYKLIYIIIKNIVKSHFPSLISKNQSGFIQNKKIIPNIVLVKTPPTPIEHKWKNKW